MIYDRVWVMTGENWVLFSLSLGALWTNGPATEKIRLESYEYEGVYISRCATCMIMMAWRTQYMPPGYIRKEVHFLVCSGSTGTSPLNRLG